MMVRFGRAIPESHLSYLPNGPKIMSIIFSFFRLINDASHPHFLEHHLRLILYKRRITYVYICA